MKKLIKKTEKKLDSVTAFKDTLCGCYNCLCACNTGDKGSASNPTANSSARVKYINNNTK